MRPLTYADLLQQIDATVEQLHALGVARGDRVALVLPNGPEMAVAFLAVACTAASAPLNPAYRAQEFDFFLADLDARALIVSAEADSAATAVAQARQIPILPLTPDRAGGAGRFTLSVPAGSLSTAPLLPAAPTDVALVLHTSGTTSRPKMVPLTHGNLAASAAHIGRTLQLSAQDRCLNVMPLFHIHGLVAALLSSLAAGAIVVCTPGFYAPHFFDWMETFQPTWYTAVLTMHQAILPGPPPTRPSSPTATCASSAPHPPPCPRW